jgi:hypothetical protein
LLNINSIPFRRAYSDDPKEFSVPDQFPSLLLAASGVPHRSPTEYSNKSVWTIGVDLGHRPEKEVSTLVLTLVCPDGGLVGAWAIKQPLDETAQAETLSILLGQCKEKITAIGKRPQIVIIRDGRMFKNEDCDIYRRFLGSDVSLFEYRKRGNPQMTCFDGAEQFIRKPYAALVPGSNTMFLITAPPKNERAMTAVAKITWRSEWNRLGLKPAEIANILVASAASPGLGLQPRHLPAGIYWADGIAGNSEDDLRFIGVPFVRC